MEFESKGAFSINFVFNNFYLPEGADLYVGNTEGTMLYGPVTSKENSKDGYFLTDLIVGDKVTIYLFEPKDVLNISKLTIKRVVHGYKNLFYSETYGNFGGSWSCHNDVVCFPEWSKESDAIALVLLSNGEEWCSGSLLMSAGYSFRPYFLTAFHCIDTFENGVLSDAEISDAQRWLFKFQYKKSSCSGNSATTGITYNSGTFRAAWNSTDFALMEMNTPLIGDSRFTWLGWDRSGNNPTSGTGIHHPFGDVMKISFDNHTITPNGQIINWPNNITSPINSHWTVGYDDGTTQGGSSGSPLFNENGRVVGQLHGGNPGCAPITKMYGRFNVSWTGGGTNITRLSNWLDPTSTGVMTTNTSRTPTISGPSPICTQGTYSIENFPAGATVQWSASPAGFVSSIQANGNSATVTTISNGVFTLKVDVVVMAGDTIELTKQITVVGNPYINYYSSNNLMMLDDDNTYFQVLRNYDNSQYQGSLTVSTSDGATVQWSKISGTMGWSSYQNTVSVFNKTNSSLVLQSSANNSCGSTTKRFYFYIGPAPLLIYPNPATDILTVEAEAIEAVSGGEMNVSTETLSHADSDLRIKPYIIQLWHERQGLVRSVKSTKRVTQISLHGLPKGMYFVHVQKEGEAVQKQMLWVR